MLPLTPRLPPRHFTRLTPLLLTSTPRSFFATHPRPPPDEPQEQQEYSPEDLKAARSWLAQLTPSTIPRSICHVSYSRSSGPGGQNVNKYFLTNPSPSLSSNHSTHRVNSKATLKIPLSSLLPLLPPILHPPIRSSSRYLAPQSESLVIHSDESRKQSQNLDACFGKLYDLLVGAGKGAVRGETSEGQRRRVRELEKANNEARLKMKKARSSKKNSRSNRRDD
ncbi:hypothetical protein FQN54_009403 [Arachnomyces sp. PD_36]|nr:hypothetical protein FQN54_009403 [Arachnomyces sp. PD_36]